jgi:Fur family zinc uptake transcriptional regulator
MAASRKSTTGVLTPLRSAVLEVLVDQTSPLSAYEVLIELSKRRGKRVSPPTVYRSLDALCRAGLVGRIESQRVFFARSQPELNVNSVIYSCHRCGRADEVEDRTIFTQVLIDASRLNFSVEREMHEVVGVCGDCRQADPGEARGS